MRQLPSVFRLESFECNAQEFPTLASAMALRPSHPESQVVTSARGVLLAEAEPVSGPGSVLCWVLTLAGQDVIDRSGWTGPLSTADVDTVLAVALAEDFAPCKRHRYDDGDVCSRCDAVRPMREAS